MDWRNGLEDCVIRGFGFALAIEEQGIIGSAADGEVVEPGVGVGHTPEGDAIDGGTVLDEHVKELGITLGKGLLLVVGEAGGDLTRFAAAMPSDRNEGSCKATGISSHSWCSPLVPSWIRFPPRVFVARSRVPARSNASWAS